MDCIGIGLVITLLLVALSLSLVRNLRCLRVAFAEGTVSLQIQLIYWFGYLHFELTEVFLQVVHCTGFYGHGLYGFSGGYSKFVIYYQRLG